MGFSAPPTKQQGSTLFQGSGQMTPQQGMSSFGGGGFGGGISPQIAGAFGNLQPRQNPMPNQMTPQQGMSRFGGGFNGMNPMMARLLQQRGG